MRLGHVSLKRGLLLLGLLCCFALTLSAAEPVTFTIVAQPPGTGPYNYAATMAKFMNDALPAGSTVNVVPRGGSMANPTTLDMGRADAAIAGGASTRWAWDGNPEVYEKYGKHPNIRLVTMGNLTVNFVFAVARKEYVERTGNDTLEKLLNAKEMPRIAIKPPGSDVPPQFSEILRLMGKDLEDYKKAGRLIQIQPSQIGEMMRDGRVDAYFEATTLQHPSVTEIALTNDLIFLPISAEVVEKLSNIGLNPVTMKAGSYRGLDEDYHTAAAGNNVIAYSGASEESIYLLTKALIERRDEFIEENPQLRTWVPEQDLEIYKKGNNPVPLHPGAARYYKEIGWIQ